VDVDVETDMDNDTDLGRTWTWENAYMSQNGEQIEKTSNVIILRETTK
jgi:hypothetical protein